MAEERIHEVGGRTLDLATVVGLICGFALVGAAIWLGGTPGSFFNPPSILIVIGGTLGVTTACYSLGEMFGTIRVVGHAIFRNTQEPFDAAYKGLQVAEMARKQGVLALQNVAGSVRNEPFFHQGISMVIDGTPGEEVEYILRRDLQATIQRHRQSASVLRKMAEFAPAMGLIGLVQMLGNLQDPTAMANMVFLPLASKLERNAGEEALINQIFLLSAVSIGRQENPRRLEMLLNSILPPSQRVQYFD